MSGQNILYNPNWPLDVASYSNSISEINSNIPKLNISKTTLAPFANFSEHIVHLNQSLVSFQTFVETQSANLKQAGENIKANDSAENAAIQANIANGGL